MANLKRWTIADTDELYNVNGWGQGYFGIGPEGHLHAFPARDGAGIDIKELLEHARSEGLALPLLIRFSDILQDRLRHLHEAFATAIKTEGYEGHYLGVYPIKVNQQRQVVEEIVKFGATHNIGLEVGSKPELYAVLAMLEAPGTQIVCNGYKDASYVRLALLGQKLGKQVFLVVEKPKELGLILSIAKELGVRPNLGIRIKLVSSGSGKWEDSGGDHSKFGLSAAELVEAVSELRALGHLEDFRLIHMHLGSQITNIRRIKEAMREVTRYLVELHKLGCAIDHVDLGGGLGVDYDGSRTAGGFSINYTEQEYANDIVGALVDVCRQEGLPHPTIITESGRALTAHHALLAFNVLDSASLERPDWHPPADAPEEETPELVPRLEELHAKLSRKTLHEYWHDALHLRDEANSLFALGHLSLHARARVDQTFWMIARRVERLMSQEKRVPDEFEQLETLLADKYFCNFSIFQSLPDAWALGQEFPVMPLHRLAERPTRKVILQDITCDSDGQLRSYIGAQDGAAESRNTLTLHALRSGEPYYLAVFLTGAYQEILGDLHNLFGNTNTIHVALNEDGTWRYDQVIHGENVADVLAYVQFHREALVDRIERQTQAAVQRGELNSLQAKQIRNTYVQGLTELTYLEQPGDDSQGGPTKRGAKPRSAAVKAGSRKPLRPSRKAAAP